MKKDTYDLIEAETFVYVMEWEGKAKIGISRDPSKRLRQLQMANPGKITLVGSRGFSSKLSATAIERAIHRKFDARRLLGEWFDVSPAKAMAAVADAWDPDLHHPHYHPDMPREVAGTGIFARWKWHRDHDLMLPQA